MIKYEPFFVIFYLMTEKNIPIPLLFQSSLDQMIKFKFAKLIKILQFIPTSFIGFSCFDSNFYSSIIGWVQFYNGQAKMHLGPKNLGNYTWGVGGGDLGFSIKAYTI